MVKNMQVRLRTACPRSITAVSFQYPNRRTLLMYSSAMLMPPVKPTLPSMTQIFRVIPVVEPGEIVQPVEIAGANALFLQHVHKIVGHQPHGAHVVVNDPHVHSLLHLADQNLFHLVPHIARMNDEIFQEDKALGRLQLGDQFRKQFFAAGEIAHLGVLIHRRPRPIAQVFRLTHHLRTFLTHGSMASGFSKTARA